MDHLAVRRPRRLDRINPVLQLALAEDLMTLPSHHVQLARAERDLQPGTVAQLSRHRVRNHGDFRRRLQPTSILSLHPYRLGLRLIMHTLHPERHRLEVVLLVQLAILGDEDVVPWRECQLRAFRNKLGVVQLIGFLLRLVVSPAVLLARVIWNIRLVVVVVVVVGLEERSADLWGRRRAAAADLIFVLFHGWPLVAVFVWVLLDPWSVVVVLIVVRIGFYPWPVVVAVVIRIVFYPRPVFIFLLVIRIAVVFQKEHAIISGHPILWLVSDVFNAWSIFVLLGSGEQELDACWWLDVRHVLLLELLLQRRVPTTHILDPTALLRVQPRLELGLALLVVCLPDRRLLPRLREVVVKLPPRGQRRLRRIELLGALRIRWLQPNSLRERLYGVVVPFESHQTGAVAVMPFRPSGREANDLFCIHEGEVVLPDFQVSLAPVGQDGVVVRCGIEGRAVLGVRRAVVPLLEGGVSQSLMLRRTLRGRHQPIIEEHPFFHLLRRVRVVSALLAGLVLLWLAAALGAPDGSEVACVLWQSDGNILEAAWGDAAPPAEQAKRVVPHAGEEPAAHARWASGASWMLGEKR
mmetsp:Transcript_40859/g.99028  ORF Transcript_40859/g.99028 Transcript_40859/m.99028 type:complete len:580 (+) Transcript_40859:672-2411(+)